MLQGTGHLATVGPYFDFKNYDSFINEQKKVPLLDSSSEITSNLMLFFTVKRFLVDTSRTNLVLFLAHQILAEMVGFKILNAKHTDSKEMATYKLGIIGEHDVGKTSLITKYAQGAINSELDKAPNDWYTSSLYKQINYQGEEILLSFQDFDPDYDTDMMHRSFRTSRGVILLYSVTNKASFEELTMHRERTMRYMDVEIFPFVLVGNKIDEKTREVSTTEGQEFAAAIKSPFLEISVLTGENMDQVVPLLLETIKKTEKLKNKSNCRLMCKSVINLSFQTFCFLRTKPKYHFIYIIIQKVSLNGNWEKE